MPAHLQQLGLDGCVDGIKDQLVACKAASRHRGVVHIWMHADRRGVDQHISLHPVGLYILQGGNQNLGVICCCCKLLCSLPGPA